MNATGKLCIEVNPKSKVAFISESLCIGCGICVKKCPFEAINIINLPKDLESNTTHRYGANTFKLHRCVAAPALLCLSVRIVIHPTHC